MSTADPARTPKPFKYDTLLSGIWPPSLLAAPPLDMSRSTGPEAFDAEMKLRSLTYFTFEGVRRALAQLAMPLAVLDPLATTFRLRVCLPETSTLIDWVLELPVR